MYNADPKRHPALIAGTPNLSQVTDKYRFIPSGDYVETVERMGWTLAKVQGGSEFGKHLMTFNHADYELPGGDKLTILTRNAHDGSAAFVSTLGIFRFVCSNGLMVGTAFESYSVRHVGFTEAKVEQSIERLLTQAPKVVESIDRFQQIVPTESQTLQFLGEAAKLRKVTNPLELNACHRVADDTATLWTLLNRVQENLLQGGYINRGRRARTLRAVDKHVTINRALWDIAEKIAA